MDYTIDPTTFSQYWRFAASHLFIACMLAYGVLLVLLATSAYLIYHRTTGGQGALSIATSVMAVLATAQLGILVYGTGLGFHLFLLAIQGELWSNSPRAYSAMRLDGIFSTVEDFLLVTNNAVTDSLFVYRCFMVWGRNFRVVIVPIFMVVATTVLGYLCAYSDDDLNANECIDYRAVFLLSIVTNFVLMALTAGRIWWIRRDACVLLESASVRRYNTVIAMILESGAIYCVTAIIYVISVSLWGPYATSSNIIRGALPQIMNIAPTLIIVRVGLGHSVEDTGSDRPVLPRVGAGNRDAPHPFVGRSRSPSFVIDIRAGCDADTPDDISLEVRGKEI